VQNGLNPPWLLCYRCNMSCVMYSHPPVVERALAFGCTLTEEAFQTKLASWGERVKQAFPSSKIQRQWQIQIAEKNGMPFLSSEGQKLTTKYQFFQHSGEDKKQGIQIWQDKISFNLFSSAENPRSFVELREIANTWAPQWASHFGVSSVHGIRLEYVNLLSPKTVPGFCSDGRIRLGEILTAFKVPGPYKDLTSPFDFQFNMVANQPDFPMAIHASLKGAQHDGGTLRLLFRASTENSERSISLDAAKKEMDTAHSSIVSVFDAFFSEEAKNSFGQIK